MVKVIVARFELEKTILKKIWQISADGRLKKTDTTMSTFTLDIGGTLGQVWPRHPSNYEFDHGGLTKNQVRVPNQHDLGGVAYFLDQPNDIYKWRKWRFFLACILSALKFCRVPQKNWQTKLMFHWFLELTHVCCLSLPIWMMNVHWWWMCVGDESALANDWPFQCLLPHVCWHLHDIPQPLPWPLLGLGWRWVTTKQLLSLLRCRRRGAWFARSSVESQGHERTGLAWGLTAAGFLMFLYVFVSICDLFISISCLSIHIYPSIHPSIHSIPINRYE
jgi:hypothetical protein